MNEHALQKQVADHLAHVLDDRVTYWTALDHAGKLSPRQAGDRKRRGVKRGIPDIEVIWRNAHGFPCLLFIELKRPDGGGLTPEQKEFRGTMAALRVPYSVCRSIEEVDAALNLAGVPHLRVAALAAREG